MRGFSKKNYSRSKYGNKKVTYKGMKFDSIGECDCYEFYELMERTGEITLLGTQPKIYMTDARILYKPDFYYYDKMSKRTIYVDYKGKRTTAFQLKKRLWKHYGPSILTLCAGYGLNIEVIETIIPIRGGST